MMSTPASPATFGFAPLLGKAPRVLILGSLPSQRSVQEQQYYGHPRNRFWPLMGELFGFDPGLPYPQRCQFLLSEHIAVWDVLACGIRPGSLDADIQRDSEQANPIAALLHDEPDISHIFFNGRAAQDSFRRHVAMPLAAAPSLTTLPSTSPANAAWQLPRLLQAWRVVREALR